MYCCVIFPLFFQEIVRRHSGLHHDILVGATVFVIQPRFGFAILHCCGFAKSFEQLLSVFSTFWICSVCVFWGVSWASFVQSFVFEYNEWSMWEVLEVSLERCVEIFMKIFSFLFNLIQFGWESLIFIYTFIFFNFIVLKNFLFLKRIHIIVLQLRSMKSRNLCFVLSFSYFSLHFPHRKSIP